VRPAVDHEPRGSSDIHALVEQRLAGELAGRQEQVREENQQCADPTGNFDR
jgi:hypothetical protein